MTKIELTEQEKQNLTLWNSWRTPPDSALKKIKGGRLAGMTDIDPMWRIGSLTRAFGPVGIGWYYEVHRTWTEPAPEQEVMCFAEVWLYVRDGDSAVSREPAVVRGDWSKPIVGIGGNKLVMAERNGLHASDDGFKMAVTDALGGCCKLLGIAADVYAGRMDDSKYAPRGGDDAPPGRAPSGTAQEAKLCEECGGPMWDNTKDKPFPNSPDYKCKKCGHKEWVRASPAAAPPAASS